VSLTWESGGIGEPLDEQEPMLNYSKRNPTIFFGGVGEVYIVGWVLTGYLFDCPQNSRLFFPLRPERLHRVSPSQSGPGHPRRRADRAALADTLGSGDARLAQGFQMMDSGRPASK
jgi:hypothetical protein